jgi:hypothetical protein
MCGKIGHKKENCWENPKNKKSKNDRVAKDVAKEDRFCDYCKKKGHTEPFCNKKKKDEKDKKAKGKDEETESEMVMMVQEDQKGIKSCQDVWIADSGASMHATNSTKGMYDVTPCEFYITIGDGTGIKATCMGKKKLVVLQPDEKTVTITLTQVYFIPGLHSNLFSITDALSKGARLMSEGLNLVLGMGKSKLIFDHIIKSPTGYVVGMKTQDAREQAFPAMEKNPKMDLNQLHK